MGKQRTFYEVFSHKTRAHPERIYKQIRTEDPVHRIYNPLTNDTVWFLTRYDDCALALKSDSLSKDVRRVLSPEQLAKHPSQRVDLAIMNRNMTFTDPPEHTRLRTLIHEAFTPRIVDSLRGHIQHVCDSLLDAIQTERQTDLIASYAYPLPLIVIAELMGVPAERREQFHAWTKTIVFDTDVERTALVLQELADYFREVFNERRRQPRADLISALVTVEDNGERLDEKDLLGMVCMLLVAGHETTLNLIANGVLTLLQHPEQKQQLIDNPDLMRSAVEEMLRYCSPVENTVRWALTDFELGGKVIPRGDLILVSMLAANRDPAVFENPDLFDITRTPNKHLAFGNGIHFCVGAPLARLETCIAIDTLLRRLPALALAVEADQLEWKSSLLAHALVSLPVTFQG